MLHIWKLQRTIITIAFLGIFSAVMVLLAYAVLSMANHDKSSSTELVLEVKKMHMKELVNNFIIRMETVEADTLEFMQVHMQILQQAIAQDETKIWELDYLKRAIALHTHDTLQLNILVYDAQNGDIIYERNPPNDTEIGLVDRVADIKKHSASHKEVLAGEYVVLLYVDWEDIYAITQAKIHTEIHNMSYEKNQYMWVNKIINYDGGDNYAIRLIHPSLVDTEGVYLSTNSPDQVGNYPYLFELNGVMKNGEVFNSYYFKNLQDDTITEKISYAKLYKPYDWVIATGVPLEDLKTHVSDIDENTASFIISNIILMLIIFSIGFFCVLYLLLRNQKKYLINLEGIVKEEIEIDLLTNALSRKFGDKCLNQVFDRFTKTKISPVVFLLDIDDFKIVNDTYGHATGDIVLREISQAVLSIIRADDYFIRWGGEEFVLLIHHITETDAQDIANKIVKHIFDMEFECNTNKFKVSTSMGGSMFLKSDKNYEDAMKRADAALYYIKRNGKNRALLDCKAT